MRLPGFLIAFILLLIPSARAADADQALYVAPPPGAAFVRIFNAQDAALSAHIGPQTYPSVSPMDASDYKVVMEGRVPVQLSSGVSQTSAFKQGGYYTVLAGSDGQVTVYTDPAVEDDTKAQMVLYNIDAPDVLSLKAQNATLDVITATAPGTLDKRAINPLKVDFTVLNAAGEKIQTFAPLILERARVYNVFYAGGKAVLLASKTDVTP